MFLEGQIDWMLVLAVAAALGWALALFGLWQAMRNGTRHVSATDQLDLIQRVAEDSQKRLLETLNAVPVALVETDKQGKFVFANRAAQHLLGRREAELTGLRFHSATWGITFPDGRPVPPDLLPSARALRGQTVKGFQHLIANPSTRRKMTVSVTAMPIEDDKGQITGSIAALVESEGLQTPEIVAPVFDSAPVAAPTSDLTRRVFDAASSALVVVAPDGVVRELNPVAAALAGVDGQAAPQARFTDLFAPESEREAVQAALAQAALTPAGDAPALHIGEDEAAVSWSILPLAGPDGAVDALLLAGERAETASDTPSPDTIIPLQDDVDARLEAARAEIAAAQAQAAQAQAQAEFARREAERARQDAEVQLAGGRRMENVGRLTGGLAHDFNALLGVMTGALDMMLRQADDPSRVRRLGQAALTAGRRGEELTRRLTAFAHGEDEQPALQVLDVALLLRGMEGRLRAQAGAGEDLMIETPAAPTLARLDPVAFEGAVVALVRNAVEATEGEGSVAVRLEALLEGGLRLSVRDSGPGMDRELAARAIEPFFTTREGAAGLGLSQAYAFARQSGGALSIDSGPGEGAEVSITLPEAA